MSNTKSLILLLGIMLSGCANEALVPEPPTPQEAVSKAQAKRRSVTEALQIANNYYHSGSSMSRAASSATVQDLTVIRDKVNSRSTGNDTLMYAVNNPDGDGFLLISAPENVTPIIGIIEEGQYEDPETAENESFQYAMALAGSYISRFDTLTVNNGLEVIQPVVMADTIHSIILSSRRINVNWDQGWPGNMFCPNGKSGCLPICMAMLCSYFEKPQSISLTYSDRDQDEVILNWSEIKKHTGINLVAGTQSEGQTHYDDCASLEDHKNLARFVRQIGEISETTYGTSTSTSTSNIMSTIKTLIPTSRINYITQTTEALRDLLVSRNGVAIMIGRDLAAKTGGAWLVDGVLHTQTTVINYNSVAQIGGTESDSDTTVTTTDNYYLHINWTWGGHCNGYFYMGIFNTAGAYNYDYTFLDNSSQSHNFDDSLTYMFVY
jgi:hypothetical protein